MRVLTLFSGLICVCALDITHTFSNSLFVNVPVNASEIKPLLHPDLTIRSYEGSAWLSVIATQVTYTKFGPVPVPGLTKGVLVRTYVQDKQGNNGVFYFCLSFSSSTYASVADKMYFKSRVPQWTIDSGMNIDVYGTAVNFNAPQFPFSLNYTSLGAPLLPNNDITFFVNSANFWFFQSADKKQLFRSKTFTKVPHPAVVVKPFALAVEMHQDYPIPFTASNTCGKGGCFYLPEFTAVLQPQEQISQQIV